MPRIPHCQRDLWRPLTYAVAAGAVAALDKVGKDQMDLLVAEPLLPFGQRVVEERRLIK